VGLINREKRRQVKAERQKQRAAILDTARALFLQYPYDGVTLEAVAKRAQVKSGLPSLLFGSKEGLFFELLLAEVRAWLDELRESPEGSGAPAAIAASMSARPTLTRLWSLALSALDLRQEFEVGRSAFAEIAAAIEETGRALDGAAGSSSSGSARRLQRALVVAPGLDLFARPPRGMEAAVSPLGMDFEKELAHLLAE
jgi:AcrR family transcriptional regulator